MVRNLVGDRQFYRRVMATATPIILQNAITNFVSLLDNVMVGQLSTAQIGGVTIANNNLLFIFMLALYGGASGAGIFTTQYFGSGNHDGIRHTFRFKLIISLLLTAVGCGIFYFGSDAHHPEDLAGRKAQAERIVELLGLTEEDKFILK